MAALVNYLASQAELFSSYDYGSKRKMMKKLLIISKKAPFVGKFESFGANTLNDINKKTKIMLKFKEI